MRTRRPPVRAPGKQRGGNGLCGVSGNPLGARFLRTGRSSALTGRPGRSRCCPYRMTGRAGTAVTGQRPEPDHRPMTKPARPAHVLTSDARPLPAGDDPVRGRGPRMIVGQTPSRGVEMAHDDGRAPTCRHRRRLPDRPGRRRPMFTLTHRRRSCSPAPPPSYARPASVMGLPRPGAVARSAEAAGVAARGGRQHDLPAVSGA